MEKMNYHQHGDDILVEQTKTFLRTVLGLYVTVVSVPGIDLTLTPDMHSAESSISCVKYGSSSRYYTFC